MTVSEFKTAVLDENEKAVPHHTEWTFAFLRKVAGRTCTDARQSTLLFNSVNSALRLKELAGSIRVLGFVGQRLLPVCDRDVRKFTVGSCDVTAPVMESDHVACGRNRSELFRDPYLLRGPGCSDQRQQRAKASRQ